MRNKYVGKSNLHIVLKEKKQFMKTKRKLVKKNLSN